MSFSPETYQTARQKVSARFQTTYGAAYGDERASPLYGAEVTSLPPLTSRRYDGIVPQLLDFPFLNEYYQNPILRPGQVTQRSRSDESCKDCSQAPKEQLACGHRFCGRHFEHLDISDNPIRRRRQWRCSTCGRWGTRDDYFISYESVGYTAGDPPSDRSLGRLARTLYRDSPKTLAILLDLPEEIVDRARDQRAHNDESVERMRILYSWRMSNPNRSTADLINLLSRTNTYYYKDLTGAINARIRRQQYDIPDDIVDTVPQFDTDMYVASQHIGPEYPFLLLELGLLWMEVETQKYAYVRDLSHVIYQLLLLWRVKNHQQSTVRQLLDAANFLGINTSVLEKQIKSRKHPLYHKPYLTSIYNGGNI